MICQSAVEAWLCSTLEPLTIAPRDFEGHCVVHLGRRRHGADDITWPGQTGPWKLGHLTQPKLEQLVEIEVIQIGKQQRRVRIRQHSGSVSDI